MDVDDLKSLQAYEFSESEEDEAGVGPISYFPQFLVCAVSIIQGMMEGSVIAYSAIIVPAMEADPLLSFRVNGSQKSLIASLMMLGQGFGALMAGVITSFLGRKRVHAVLLPPVCILWFVLAYPPNPEAIVASRFLQGLLMGVRIAVGQLYAAEAAHQSVRGTQTSMTKIFLPLGTFVVAVMSLLVSWRAVVIVCAVFPLFICPVYYFLPESPIWLIMKKRRIEAEKALRFLRGENYDVVSEVNEIWSHVEESKKNRESVKDILDWHYLKPIVFCVAAITLRMFTGASVVLHFMKQFLTEANPEAAVGAEYAVIIVAGVQFIVGVLSARLFDWLGRRMTAIGSSLLMGFGLTSFGLAFFCQEHKSSLFCEEVRSFSVLPFISLMVFMAGYSSGVSSVVFVLVSEMIPVRVKNVVSAVLFGYNSVFTFVVLMTFWPLAGAIGKSGAFWFYAVICLGLSLMFFFFLHETKGQSAVEIERRLTSRAPSVAAPVQKKKSQRNVAVRAPPVQKQSPETATTTETEDNSPDVDEDIYL